MDHSKEEMIKHLESAVKEFKDFDRLLWLNNHICRPPYDDDIKGFLNRAKERICSATRTDFESAYDECIKSGIEVPNGCDVLKIIGNKAATPEDKEILIDVFYEWCRGLVMEQCTKKLVVGYAARVVSDLNRVTQGLILNGVVCLPKSCLLSKVMLYLKEYLNEDFLKELDMAFVSVGQKYGFVSAGDVWRKREARARAEGESVGEQNKAREMARVLKAMGDSTEKIVAVSGLTAAEVEAL